MNRIQERIAARRKEQIVEEEKKSIEMEKKRITDGKALSELKQKFDRIRLLKKEKKPFVFRLKDVTKPK